MTLRPPSMLPRCHPRKQQQALSFHVGLLLVLSSFPRFPYLFHHGFVSVSAIMCVKRWTRQQNVGAKLKQKPNNGCDGQTKGRWFLCESYIAPNSNRVVFDDKDCEVKFLRTSKRARNFEAKNQSACASVFTIRIGLIHTHIAPSFWSLKKRKDFPQFATLLSHFSS